ncbi:MAG: phosphoglycerate kinase [Firmicutes bacterium]|nr:phosphoglycerate kinase [Bacillota bacterium]
MTKATVRELINLKGARVFLRADLNVPQDDNGNITDQTRITASLNTLRYLLDKGARVIMASHLGRPKGRDEKYTLKPVFERIQELLPDVKMFFANDVLGKDVKAQISRLKDGQMLLLENVRFYKEEEENNLEFAKKLSEYADYYVNDAFGAAHRAHASTEGITRYLPAVAGFLMETEVKILGEAIRSPQRPLTVIIGGKKIADKASVISGLLGVADNILIGGGMSYTFAKSQGGEIGNSIVNENLLDYAKEVMATSKSKGTNLVLPIDSVVADKFGPDAHTNIVPTNKIPNGWEGFDIGPKTIEEFKKIIKKSKTVIWSGPMGVFEFDIFANGTREVAKVIVESEAVSIIGGGDSASAVVKFGFADKVTHISTGGSASLEMIEGKKLPGIEAILGIEAKIK